MKTIFTLLALISLTALSSVFAQETKEVMRIYQKEGVLRHILVSDLDSISVDSEDPSNKYLTLYRKNEGPRPLPTSKIDSITFFDTPNCGAQSGRYIGIIGFNDDIKERLIAGPLFEDDESKLHYFINSLTKGNGTVLYHAVNESLKKINAQCPPYNLSNVSIVTFTDGLDQGSWMLNLDKYSSEDELLTHVSNQIDTTTINDLPLHAYSIGIKGTDITDEATFTNNLKMLASSNENVEEVEDMDAVYEKFGEIANSLSINNTTITKSQTLKLTIPGQTGKIRFTFDDVADAALSNLFIEGTVNYENSEFSLQDVVYKGMSSTSGTTVTATQNGINLSFTFDYIITSNNILLNTAQTQQFSYISGSKKWQVNSEFVPSQDTETEVDQDIINNSALVLLVLDCSSSLGEDFDKMKDAAKYFITTFLEGTGTRPTAPTFTSLATGFTYESAVIRGTLIDEGSHPVQAFGIEYSEIPDFAGGTGTRIYSPSKAFFDIVLSDLKPATKYYYRLFSVNGGLTTYTAVNYFTTLAIKTPTVETENAKDITYTSATLSGSIVDEGDGIENFGIMFSRNQDELIDKKGTKVPITEIINDYFFSETIDTLTEGIKYYYVAYGSNQGGTVYGTIKSFITAKSLSMNSIPASSISSSGATLGGCVVSKSDIPIIKQGIIYSSDPLLQDAIEIISPSTLKDTFFIQATELLFNTKYYYKAFCQCEYYYTAGKTLTFTTSQTLTTKTVPASEIGTTSAMLGGITTSHDGSLVTKQGVVYSTDSTFQTNVTTLTSPSTATDTFLLKTESLIKNTTYYYKSFCENENEIVVYGQKSLFTSKGTIEVSNLSVHKLTSFDATIIGTISNNPDIIESGVIYSTDSDFTDKITTKTQLLENASFQVEINELIDNQIYFLKAYVTSQSGTNYSQYIMFQTPSVLVDVEGNTYKTVKIGDQIWMAENLNVTKYPNEKEIPLVTENQDWLSLENNNDDDAYSHSTNGENLGYGAIYTYAAALNACPLGWHLPSDQEWVQLGDFLIDQGNAGNIANVLKKSTGWDNDGNGTDDYGFSALPGGSRNPDGAFVSVGEYGKWWTSTEYGGYNANGRLLAYDLDSFSVYSHGPKSDGRSIRCIKDKETVDNDNGETIQDIDGNEYRTAKIGEQVWMAENLRTSTYSDGEKIPYINEDSKWAIQKEGAYCWYVNESINNERYGSLYNWYAIDSKKLCPKGWHVPTYDDWLKLNFYIESQNVGDVGPALKGKYGWGSFSGTNIYGFSALSGGQRNYNGTGNFSHISQVGTFWTSTESNTNEAANVALGNYSNLALSKSSIKAAGRSVRCIMD